MLDIAGTGRPWVVLNGCVSVGPMLDHSAEQEMYVVVKIGRPHHFRGVC